MKAKGAILTRGERDVLVLAAAHPGDQYFNNTEIAQHLGISINRVKRLIYQACIKLKARNRIEAILSAIRHGEIRLNEIYTPDELGEFWSALYSDGLRRIAYIVREGLEHGQLTGDDEQIIRMDKTRDTVLTKHEKDILILVGRGLTNREMADTLYMSISTVRTYLYRAYTKLGVHKKADAHMMALKRREICIIEMYSIKELLEYLAPLGTDSIEEVTQLLKQKSEQEPVPTGS